MRLAPSPERPELDELIARAKARDPMTKEERRAQAISWVAGELGLAHPELTSQECYRRAEVAFDER